MADENNEPQQKPYGKRPLWQWLLLYLVIGSLVYYVVYYVVAQRRGVDYSASPSQSTSPYGN